MKWKLLNPQRAAKQAETVVMLMVFATALFYVGTWKISDSMPPLKIKQWDSTHLWLLQTAAIEFCYAFTLWWKAHRFKTCIFTKIAVWMYGVMTLMALIYLIFRLKYHVFFYIFPRLAAAGMSLMFVLFLFLQLYRAYKRRKEKGNGIDDRHIL